MRPLAAALLAAALLRGALGAGLRSGLELSHGPRQRAPEGASLVEAQTAVSAAEAEEAEEETSSDPYEEVSGPGPSGRASRNPSAGSPALDGVPSLTSAGGPDDFVQHGPVGTYGLGDYVQHGPGGPYGQGNVAHGATMGDHIAHQGNGNPTIIYGNVYGNVYGGVVYPGGGQKPVAPPPGGAVGAPAPATPVAEAAVVVVGPIAAAAGPAAAPVPAPGPGAPAPGGFVVPPHPSQKPGVTVPSGLAPYMPDLSWVFGKPAPAPAPGPVRASPSPGPGPMPGPGPGSAPGPGPFAAFAHGPALAYAPSPAFAPAPWAPSPAVPMLGPSQSVSPAPAPMPVVPPGLLPPTVTAKEVVKVSLTLLNLNYDELSADRSLSTGVTESVSKQVATSAGMDPSMVKTTLSPGSVVATCYLVFPPGASDAAVKMAEDAVSTQSVADAVAAAVANVDGIDSVATGAVTALHGALSRVLVKPAVVISKGLFSVDSETAGALEREDVCEPICVEGQGICNDGLCFCKDPFIGEQCERKAAQGWVARLSMVLATTIVTLAGVLGLLFGAILFMAYQECKRPQEMTEARMQTETWKVSGGNK